jgi:hypothetical protein
MHPDIALPVDLDIELEIMANAIPVQEDDNVANLSTPTDSLKESDSSTPWTEVVRSWQK